VITEKNVKTVESISLTDVWKPVAVLLIQYLILSLRSVMSILRRNHGN